MSILCCRAHYILTIMTIVIHVACRVMLRLLFGVLVVFANLELTLRDPPLYMGVRVPAGTV